MPVRLQGLGRGTIADFGEDQTEYGEAAWQAADLDRALMQAHDRANNCQAQPCSTFGTRATGIDAVEAFEQMRDVLCGDANPGVPDRELHGFAVLLDQQRDVCADGAMPNRIGQ